MSDKYKSVELKDGVDVQFVGVYALKWQREWGRPTIGFVQDDESDLKSKLDKAIENEKLLLSIINEQKEELNTLKQSKVSK